MTTLEAERQAFLDAIIAEPEDDALRLIYADWIDDRGESERAKLIRVQIELDQSQYKRCSCIPLRHVRCNHCVLSDRESHLLETVPISDESLRYWNPIWKPAWLRGFVCSIRMDWSDWNARADQITRQHPVEEVRLLTMPVLAEDYAVPGVSPQKYWLEGRSTIDIDTWIARTRREALIQLLKLNWPTIKRFILPDARLDAAEAIPQAENTVHRY